VHIINNNHDNSSNHNDYCNATDYNDTYRTNDTAATGMATVFPTTVYMPGAAPYEPTGIELELFQYALSLINNDRQSAGLPPVTLAYNAAAAKTRAGYV